MVQYRSSGVPTRKSGPGPETRRTPLGMHGGPEMRSKFRHIYSLGGNLYPPGVRQSRYGRLGTNVRSRAPRGSLTNVTLHTRDQEISLRSHRETAKFPQHFDVRNLAKARADPILHRARHPDSLSVKRRGARSMSKRRSSPPLPWALLCTATTRSSLACHDLRHPGVQIPGTVLRPKSSRPQQGSNL